MDYEEDSVHTLDDSGAYLTQKLAQLFEVEPGDTLEIQGDHNENWEVDVAGVVENYIGHTIYMTPAYYEEMTGETNGEPNLELIKYDSDTLDEKELGRELWMKMK